MASYTPRQTLSSPKKTQGQHRQSMFSFQPSYHFVQCLFRSLGDTTAGAQYGFGSSGSELIPAPSNDGFRVRSFQYFYFS